MSLKDVNFYARREGEITNADKAYFRAKTRHRVHGLVLEALARSGMTKANVAKRLDLSPSQISRWLAMPGSNWTIDSISDLLLAMGAQIGFVAREIRNEARPEVFDVDFDRSMPSPGPLIDSETSTDSQTIVRAQFRTTQRAA